VPASANDGRTWAVPAVQAPAGRGRFRGVRILVVGGTQFVGRHVVEQAVAGGHEVTVFHRGVTEPPDLPAVEHVHGDRETGLGQLAGRAWDAAVDVCGYAPRLVRVSATALEGAVGRYCFVSSESVYAEPHPPVVTEAAPLATLGASEGEWGWYGPLKVLCERVVEATIGEGSLIVRPGYVVGPHDPTDRFTWWVRRAARGGRMLAPGDPASLLQFVDARDLGSFVVTLLERGAAGAFNADGHPLALGSLIETCLLVSGAEVEVTWAAEDWVLGRGLAELFPMWSPGEHGRVVMDATKARAHGLVNRPVEETVAATLEWDQARGSPEPMRAGLSPEREAALLAELSG
jgi:2'-hydroxyisoflavone reductase